MNKKKDVVVVIYNGKTASVMPKKSWAYEKKRIRINYKEK
jgi:hypothetical protein